MTERRVVITGLGVVAPGGRGIGELFDALLAGQKHVKPISLFDASGFATRIGGQLDDFSARDYVPKSYRKAVKVMARDIEIAVAAADLAVRDSGIITPGLEGTPTIEPAQLGCNIGAGLICADLDELAAAVNTSTTDGKFDIRAWGNAGMQNLTPLWLLKYLPNMLACHVTIIHLAKGPSNTITCGECSGILAVGEAVRAVARGACDAEIAGGAESKLNPMGLLRQGLLNRLVTNNDAAGEAMRPFDRGHCGTVIGEGGGLLVVEDRDRAMGRNARIYAEVVGFGAGCDPDGIKYPMATPRGLINAIGAALADAKLRPDEIDLLIPQGTGVPAEDQAEAQCLKQALGERGTKVPVLPSAGMTGNLFAGAGAVNLAVGAMALQRQVIPAAINCSDVDPACGLNVPNQTTQTPLRNVLIAGYAVGGQAAAMILRRHQA